MGSPGCRLRRLPHGGFTLRLPAFGAGRGLRPLDRLDTLPCSNACTSLAEDRSLGGRDVAPLQIVTLELRPTPGAGRACSVEGFDRLCA